MASFQRLIRFQAQEDNAIYFADVDSASQAKQGTKLPAYASQEALFSKDTSKTVTISKLLAPVVQPSLPIYCAGLNYHSHAAEAKMNIPKHPPLWTKPCAALACPDEDIPIGKFCAEGGLDFEGELVFITSRECKNITPEQAKDYILGYTVGNDISARIHQMPDACGGQFYFAKAFDKFAPMGPILLSPEQLEGKKVKQVTRVNGKVVQETDCMGDDMIWKPADILSWMSQETTIPAGTAVMTGTTAGVGAFMTPRTFLKDGDVVEIELVGAGAGVLSNKMTFV